MTGVRCFALSGRTMFLAIHPPRALPWAKLLRPFQGKGAKRNFKTGASGSKLATGLKTRRSP
jgi:hypothetical protein